MDFNCEYCGLPKVHYRLYGYRCANPDCQEKELEGAVQAYELWQKSRNDIRNMLVLPRHQDTQKGKRVKK